MPTPSFVPSRPAPSPPYSTHTPRLPPNHPFVSYYIPHPNPSVETFQAVTRHKHRSLPLSPSSVSSGSSHTYSSYSSTNLNQPLAPRPAVPTHHKYHEIPLALPAELSIFDPKPRQNMVSDLETIFGRSLRSFPTFGKNRKDKEDEKSSVNESRSRRILRKERERSWEDDSFWQETKSRESSDEKSVYRGLWI